MYVVDSAAAIPWLVKTAYPVHSWSSETLLAFAVGMILPIDCDNSSTVTLPKFWVVINLSDISVASSTLIP